MLFSWALHKGFILLHVITVLAIAVYYSISYENNSNNVVLVWN